MKKINFFIICGISLLGLCGCDSNNDTKNDIQEVGKISCPEMNNIKMIYKYGFITNNNDFYYLNMDLYSNDKNCKKVNSNNIEYTKIVEDGSNIHLFDINGNVYRTNYNGSEFEFDIQEKSGFSEDFINSTDIIKVINHKSDFYILKSDGVLYKNKSIYNYDSNNDELYFSFENEKIIDFGFSNYNSDIDWIKTDKSYYTSTISNKEECEKYVDIGCEHILKKNEYLTKNYSNILGLIYVNNITSDSDNKVIYKDGTVSSYHSLK